MSIVIEPKDIRYIKLGSAGGWAKDAIANGTVPFGFKQASHRNCAHGDWEAVRDDLRRSEFEEKRIPGDMREIRDFYELGSDTLWVTIAYGRLYWAFAKPEVHPLPLAQDDGPARYRETVDGWSNHALDGSELTVAMLSSALTKTAGYRRTICKIGRSEYLLRRLRGTPNETHEMARNLRSQLRSVVETMISELDWPEFETLIDLIFARGGWRRASMLGGSMPDVDLIAEQPITKETAWVQVKSEADQNVLDDYVERFANSRTADWFFFACHSPKGTLAGPSLPKARVLAGSTLAALAMDVGLVDWLMDRTK